jgi:hypothetical protein
LGIVTTTSETAFTQSAEIVYDFVTGLDGRITWSYRFTRPGQNITLSSRTTTIEAPKHAPLPDRLFEQATRRGSTPTTRPSHVS